MVDAFRAMLDELMGKERDAPLHARSNRKVDFNDPEVCKYELVASCPNQLFRNTKCDLGACGFSIHSDHLDWAEIKADWEKLDERGKDRFGYERDLLRYTEQLIRDMDRKIEKNKERAAAESRPKPIRPEDQLRLDEIKARMDECLQRSMQLGEQGDVDASMAMAQQAEVYKRQHEMLHKQLTMPDRTMTVCEVCGLFINSTDNEQRRLDHFTGKTYLGWKKIREVNDELKKKLGGGAAAGPHRGSSDRSRSRGELPLPLPPPPAERERERPSSRGEWDRERDRRYDDRRERERSPGRYGGGGGGRDYHHERDRRGYEHERGYDRGREYDRGRRDYERGRDYRERDRRY